LFSFLRLVPFLCLLSFSHAYSESYIAPGSHFSGHSKSAENTKDDYILDVPTFRSLKPDEIRGKNILIRVNVNVKVVEGHVKDDSRLRKIKSVVDFILDYGGTPILFGHNGRPPKKPDDPDDRESMKGPILEALRNILGREIFFDENGLNNKFGLILQKDQVVTGEVNLLENTRLAPDFEMYSQRDTFAQQLASLGDGIYINDAFGDIGSEGASTQNIVHYMDKVVLGPEMVREIKKMQEIAELGIDALIFGGNKLEMQRVTYFTGGGVPLKYLAGEKLVALEEMRHRNQQLISEEIDLSLFKEADALIRDELEKTSLRFSPSLSHKFGKSIWLKLETEQPTGSFKIRGTLTKMLKLRNELGEEFFHTTFVTSSTGNRGIALAYAGNKLGIKVVIYVPKRTSNSKIQKMRSLNAEVIRHGDSVEDSKERAFTEGKKSGFYFLTSHNDSLVMASYGLVAKEIMDEMEKNDKKVVSIIGPVGSGGLMAGVAAYIRGVAENSFKILGVEPEGANAMSQSLINSEIVTLKSTNTIAEGVALKKPTEKAYYLFKSFGVDVVTVTEEDIQKAINLLWKEEKIIAEGAGALPVASLLANKVNTGASDDIVLIISGKNLSDELFNKIIHKDDPTSLSL